MTEILLNQFKERFYIYLLNHSNSRFLTLPFLSSTSVLLQLNHKIFMFLFQPKTRSNTSAVLPGQTTRFGSLPTSTPPKLSSRTPNICNAGRYSLDEGGECAGRSRSSSRRRLSSGRGSEDSGNALVLGMGISAVHDAVLRGVPKIPGT